MTKFHFGRHVGERTVTETLRQHLQASSPRRGTGRGQVSAIGRQSENSQHSQAPENSPIHIPKGSRQFVCILLNWLLEKDNIRDIW